MAVNVAFWGKALKTIPRIDKAEWNQLDLISKWLVATRSGVLIMTAISAMIGGLLAIASGSFHAVNFTIAFIGLILAHASNNLINDWVDYRKGVDKDNYFRAQYGPQLLEHGFLGARAFKFYIAFTLLLAMLAGLFLVLSGPQTVLLLAGAGLFFLLFYTWPLKYIGLGEPTVVLVWGPLMIGGTFFVSSGYTWSWDVAWLATVYAMGPTSVIFGKHIDKIREDKKKKIFTLPVILGESLSRYVVLLVWIVQYLAITWFVISGSLSFVVLLVYIALPYLFKKGKAFLSPRPVTKPDWYEAEAWPLYFVRYAFEYNKRFSILFLFGIILHTLVIRLGLF